MRFVYDLLLLLAAIFCIPKWLIEKKGKRCIQQRLGIGLPKSDKPSIWIHMVSMGETKAMLPIFTALKKEHPDTPIYLSTITETGQREAQKNFKGATGTFFLPLDNSLNMYRLVTRLQPKLILLSEGDFWYNQLHFAKKRGAKILLLSGKLSKKSQKRFAQLPHLSKRLFSKIDTLCVQNADYAKRFSTLPIPEEKICITGNLKLASSPYSPPQVELENWRKKYAIAPEEIVVTVASTHPGEEERILQQLETIKGAKILLAPRHPKRFEEVRKKIGPRAILIDQMGKLPHCFALSKVAIIGGSFVEGIGGHNIYEPIQQNVPVIFGPYMEKQQGLVKLILDAGVGIQTPIERLSETVEAILFEHNRYAASTQTLTNEGANIVKESLKQISLAMQGNSRHGL